MKLGCVFKKYLLRLSSLRYVLEMDLGRISKKNRVLKRLALLSVHAAHRDILLALRNRARLLFYKNTGSVHEV